MSDQKTIEDVLRCAVEMAEPRRRAAAAQGLARLAGADDLIIFVRDEAVGRSLPGPGFPQTMRGGLVWRDLVDRAIANGEAEGIIDERPARAVGLADGTAMLLFGTPSDTSILRILLPLFGALLRMEAVAERAQAEATIARQSAAQSSEIAMKLDITRAELQRAVGVAETATRARDEFLATVSHELRTPLTSIIGWVQLLREDGVGFLAEGLDTIDRNARSQTLLIEDILDFSRINAGKLRLDVQPVDFSDVITAAVEVVRPAADAKGVRIATMFDPKAGLISGDPDRLQQVVWNLLSNAVKFTSRGGRVQVQLERVNSHTELTVSDTGEGIEFDFLPFVFDRFSQADSSSTRQHGGLGLGLGIVRHLVELHGGTVQAFSEGLGKGATFAVRLPLRIAQNRSPEHVVAPDYTSNANVGERERLTDLTGLSVLVVEDNDDARKLLTTILNRCGANVTSAESAPIALRLLDSSRPDIVISDIEMPGEDGYSLIRKIRLLQSVNSRLPAIALTAYARTVDRVRALAAGFQMHMAKPVEPTELVAAIRSLVSTHV